MKHTNKQAYTIIVVILIIGFLMVLTIGILKLVLDEMKDNTALGNYQKAYIGAESAQELALLQIKENGYGYNEPMSSDFDTNMLGSGIKDPKLSYENQGSVPKASGTIPGLGNVIMPLFTLKANGDEKTRASSITLDVGNSSAISWNILSKTAGIANVGDISSSTRGIKKGYVSSGSEVKLNYSNSELVSGFLQDPSNVSNYLLLFNSSTSPVNFTVTEVNDKSFTSPKLEIISTAEVGNYKQNIKTDVDYEKIVNRAKYSIYSGQ